MVKVLRENNEIKQIPLDCIKGATLLSKEEAENLLTQKERICTYKGESCWWWLRSPGFSLHDVANIRGSGSIHSLGTDVRNGDIYTRPALIISNLNSSNLRIGDIFEFGDYKFKIISSEYALCEEAIGKCSFRKDYEAKDANVYESSDVKTYVDNWFYNVYKDLECREYGIETDDEIFNGKKGEWANW